MRSLEVINAEIESRRRQLLSAGVLAYLYVGDSYYGVAVIARVCGRRVSHHRLVSFGGRTEVDLAGRVLDALYAADTELKRRGEMIGERECEGR